MPVNAPRGGYSEELVEGGFAIEVADAPLPHESLNLADIAHVLVLREQGIVPEHAASRLLGVLLDAQRTPVAEFGYDPVQREIDRLFADLAWVNRSPAGSGCVNGSRLPYDRSRVAALLGFDEVIEHTRDATWQAGGLLTLECTATSLVTTLSKLAEDLEIWSSKEFDYVELADGHTRGSVMMPQKRNPYALSMVRGEAGVLIGRLTGLFAVMKTPSARSDNLIFAYGEVPRSLDLASRAPD